MELERRNSSGVAKGGLATGIVGSALGAAALLGNGANLFNRGCYDVQNNGCSDDHFVNRYEMRAEQKIAELEAQLAMKESDSKTDGKILEVYKYITNRLNTVDGKLADQAVQNQATKDSFQMMSERMQCCCDKMDAKINTEKHERRCSDEAIVSYVNSTFYPKEVANVMVDNKETTPQKLYNPLPVDTCRSGC